MPLRVKGMEREERKPGRTSQTNISQGKCKVPKRSAAQDHQPKKEGRRLCRTLAPRPHQNKELKRAKDTQDKLKINRSQREIPMQQKNPQGNKPPRDLNKENERTGKFPNTVPLRLKREHPIIRQSAKTPGGNPRSQDQMPRHTGTSEKTTPDPKRLEAQAIVRKLGNRHAKNGQSQKQPKNKKRGQGKGPQG